MKLTPYWLIAASFLGIGVALYLSYYHFLGLIPECAVGGCEIVLNSVYSSIAGVPLSYLGLVYYIYMLCLAVLLAIDPESKGLKFGVVVYTAIGLLCSVGFELLQYFVIGAMCEYCAISAFATLLLFGIAVWHVKSK